MALVFNGLTMGGKGYGYGYGYGYGHGYGYGYGYGSYGYGYGYYGDTKKKRHWLLNVLGTLLLPIMAPLGELRRLTSKGKKNKNVY
jgi:hypothetical protein